MSEAKPDSPTGYALAFNGEQIKKSCETCGFMYDDSDSYQPAWWRCNWNDGDHGMENLPSFPFKNGCKHFELHHTFSVDWDAEAKRMDAEREICEHLSSGYCYRSFNNTCESVIKIDAHTFACEKAL